MSSEQQSVNSLRLAKLVQSASVSNLKFLSKRNDIEIIESPNLPLVAGHWMALILVSGADLRLTFHAQFMSTSAKYFAERAYRGQADSLTQKRTLDFFREFCNLVAGQQKTVLAKNGIKTEASLPAVARGFDELFYQPIPGSHMVQWKLVSQDALIHCLVFIDLFNSFSLKTTEDSPSDSDIEVL